MIRKGSYSVTKLSHFVSLAPRPTLLFLLKVYLTWELTHDNSAPGTKVLCCHCRRWALRMRSQNSRARRPATGSRCVPCSRRSPPSPTRTPSCPSTTPSCKGRMRACRWRTRRCSPSPPHSSHRTPPSSPPPRRWMPRRIRWVIMCPLNLLFHLTVWWKYSVIGWWVTQHIHFHSFKLSHFSTVPSYLAADSKKGF